MTLVHSLLIEISIVVLVVTCYVKQSFRNTYRQCARKAVYAMLLLLLVAAATTAADLFSKNRLRSN